MLSILPEKGGNCPPVAGCHFRVGSCHFPAGTVGSRDGSGAAGLEPAPSRARRNGFASPRALTGAGLGPCAAAPNPGASRVLHKSLSSTARPGTGSLSSSLSLAWIASIAPRWNTRHPRDHRGGHRSHGAGTGQVRMCPQTRSLSAPEIEILIPQGLEASPKPPFPETPQSLPGHPSGHGAWWLMGTQISL